MKTIKIFEYMNSDWGRAFKRISAAFHQFAPSWVKFVNSKEEADIQLIHVVGAAEEKYLQIDTPKIIVQHCYFSAEYNRIDWPKYWEEAVMVTSFHNLPKYTSRPIPYYGMPWGADDAIFYNKNLPKQFDVFTTGHVANTECIDLLYKAVEAANKTMYHTGENFKWNTSHYKFLPYMDDVTLATQLNLTKYVSALRLIEGFELLAIEGLFCGARPIIPECDTYDWYREHAITIDTNGDIVNQLKNILSTEPTPIGQDEYNKIINKFAWKNIIPRFYEEIENKL